MRKTALSAAIAASFGTLLVAGAVVAAPPAQAAPSDCVPGTACIFSQSSGNGSWQRWGGKVEVGNVGNFMNDRTTSAWNRTDQPVCFYNDTNYNGFMFALAPGQSLGVVNPSDNDRVSSLRNCATA